MTIPKYERYGVIYFQANRELYRRIATGLRSGSNDDQCRALALFRDFCCGRLPDSPRTIETTGELGDAIFTDAIFPGTVNTSVINVFTLYIWTVTKIAGNSLTLYRLHTSQSGLDRRRRSLRQRYARRWFASSAPANTAVNLNEVFNCTIQADAASARAVNPDRVNSPLSSSGEYAAAWTELHLQRCDTTEEHSLRDQVAALRAENNRLKNIESRFDCLSRSYKEYEEVVHRLRTTCCDTEEENSLRDQVAALRDQLKSAHNTITENGRRVSGLISAKNEI